MRCYTCGFTNADGNKVCEKCGTKLKAAPAVATQAGTNPQRLATDGIPTMRSVDSSNPAWEEPETKFKCESCGHYPLRSAVSKDTPCPNCGSTGEKEAAYNGTMTFPNIFFGNGATATPKITLVDVASNKSLELDGEDMILNRDSLNPNDQSISSKQHVQLIKEKGVWYIKDLSSNHATFIQVIDKMPLESGVHVLIGNRIYRVELD